MAIFPSYLLIIVSIVLFVLVLLFLWLPVIRHFYVPRVRISHDTIEAARWSPADAILAELAEVRFFGDRVRSAKRSVQVAEKLSTGILELPHCAATEIKMPFDPRDLSTKNLQVRLFLASLGVPRILLSAYEESGQDRFLRAARETIVKWAQYEENVWLPRGLLWNDHALAERMLVLADFWRLYRHRSDYQSDAARAVLELAARTSRLLAQPSRFTFSTNHGVMQNLALWHFSLAFPTLPNVRAYARLAFERMRDQMAYYVNGEGVVLEHSPGYQAIGLRFLGLGMRYLTLLGMPVPEEWAKKYGQAKDVYTHLRLPDGYLPIFGDTRSGSDIPGPPVADMHERGDVEPLTWQREWRPSRSLSLYPVAGYSIWWHGLRHWPDLNSLAQTVLSWSHFPGHAHKHADELSLSLWAAGQRWWTNVGYWPYGVQGRSQAVSWSGSNAPHLVDESTQSVRRAELRFYSWSDDMALIDLERTGTDGYVGRRQVLWIAPNLWLALDHVRGKGKRRSRTVWTTSHEVALTEGRLPGSFHLLSRNRAHMLASVFLGSPGTEVLAYSGSLSPFAGWDVTGAGIKPAPSIVVDHAAGDSWAVAVWFLLREGHAPVEFIDDRRWIECEDPDNWRIVLPTTFEPMEIRRSGHEVFCSSSSRETRRLMLGRAEDASAERQRICDSYLQASARYPRFRLLFGYRAMITGLLGALFLLQEGLLLFSMNFHPASYEILRIISIIGWFVGGTSLVLWFDRVVDAFSGLPRRRAASIGAGR